MGKRSLAIGLVLVLAMLMTVVGCYEPLEKKDCVVMIGDSIFDMPPKNEINALQDLSGQKYRSYYKVGAELELSGSDLRIGVPTVQKQLEQALNDDSDISTIIFDGGGNDVLISGQFIGCRTNGYNDEMDESDLKPACTAMMDRALDALEALYSDMIDAGIENIVQQGYYYAKDQNLWVAAKVFQDKAKEKVKAIAAENNGVNIIYVDPRDYVDPATGKKYFDREKTEDRNTTYLVADGIHPNKDGGKKLAQMLWDTLKTIDLTCN